MGGGIAESENRWVDCMLTFGHKYAILEYCVIPHTKQEHLTRSQRYMLCRRHKHRLPYTTIR